MSVRIISGGNALITHGTTLGSSFRSDVINMERGKTVSFEIKHVGASCAGTLQFEVCNFVDIEDFANTCWVPVTLDSGATNITISGATNTLVDLADLGSKYISVNWADTGSDSNGDDTMTIYCHVKA